MSEISTEIKTKIDSVQEPADNNSSIIEEIKKINEIDFSGAFENLGGMDEVYIEIITVYYQEGITKPELLKKYYEDKDYLNLRIEVHGLKSTSYVIGANSLGDFAKRLEFSCRDIESGSNVSESVAIIDNELDTFIDSFNELLSKIGKVLGLTTTANSIPIFDENVVISNPVIIDVLNQVYELLDNYDLDQAVLMLNCVKGESPDIDKNIDYLLDLLSGYKYGETNKLIEKWIKR